MPFGTHGSVSRAYSRVRSDLMMFRYKALAPIWVIVFGLFALSGSGTIARPGVVWLVLGGLVMPAILLAAGAKLWKESAARTRDAQLLALADAQDVMRMDSDKG